MPRVYPPIEGKTTNHNVPPSILEATAGFSAGIVSTLAVHPFDVVKTRLQVNLDTSSQVGSSMRILRNVYNSEGFWQGFYRGLTPNIVGNSVSWALYFMWYGKIKDAVQATRGGDQLRSIDYFAASGISGIFTNIFTNPIWVIKTRMLSTGRNAPGAYTSIFHGTKMIYEREGIRGFWRGLIPSMIGVSHGAIQFSAYEKLKIWRSNVISHTMGEDDKSSLALAHNERMDTVEKKITNVELGNWDFLTLSALSKIFAGTITYPYQIVRARLQTYDAPTLYKGGWDCCQQIWRKERLVGFYKGLGPNILRVLPSTVVTFLVYENTKRYLPAFYAREIAGDDSEKSAAR